MLITLIFSYEIITLKKGMLIDNALPHELTKKIEGKVWNIPCAESNVQMIQGKFRVTNIAHDEETSEFCCVSLLMNSLKINQKVYHLH